MTFTMRRSRRLLLQKKGEGFDFWEDGLLQVRCVNYANLVNDFFFFDNLLDTISTIPVNNGHIPSLESDECDEKGTKKVRGDD